MGSSADPGAVLQAACDSVIADPDLAPERKNGKIFRTHCSEGAARVARALGCRELDNMMADAQYAVMTKNESGKWRRAEGRDAALHALSGGLAFAAMPSSRLGEEHGHIAAIYPSSMQRSASLGHDVPMVANVGTTDCEERSSQAFPVSAGEADYFLWGDQPC